MVYFTTVGGRQGKVNHNQFRYCTYGFAMGSGPRSSWLGSILYLHTYTLRLATQLLSTVRQWPSFWALSAVMREQI